MKKIIVFISNLLSINSNRSKFISIGNTETTGEGILNKEFFYERKRMKLDKKFKSNQFHPINVPPAVSSNKPYTQLNEDNFREIEIECIKLFEKTSKENNFNTNYFYRNILDLKINQFGFITKILNRLKKTAGNYNLYKNQIEYSEDEFANTLFHELLHMASGIIDEEKIIGFCGFEQYGKDYNIGKGLNEGYTEYLNQKYFFPESTSYHFEKIVAEMITVIIGEAKMNKLYFSADLKGLINELCKYNSKDNVMKFIVCLDFVEENRSKKFKSKIVDDKLNEYMKYIYNFIIETCNKSYENFPDVPQTEAFRKFFIDMFKIKYGCYYTENSNLNNEEDNNKKIT